MSWFSDEHKKIYSKALGALYEDVKSVSSSLIDKTGKVIVVGYNKIKESADYLDKRYHEVDQSEMDESDVSEPNEPSEPIDPSEPSEIDQSEETDESLVEMGKIYPDILVKLHRNHNNIIRIWIIDTNGDKKKITGKISSYPYVDQIIHKWFEYINKNSRGFKWYPKNELYTAYRDSSHLLNPMDNIIFRYELYGYKPYHYHPLF